MKYFIKRKTEKFKKVIFRSALLIVSAFAIFSPAQSYGSEKNKKYEAEIPDSIFTARYVFENLHSSALEILPKTTRLDMLDYWDVDSVYKASNVMEGLSWIENMDNSYMKLKVTSVSELEIKILPLKKGKVAMTINTVGDDVQAQDSQVKFYDMNLEELPVDKYFVMPEVKDFFEIPKGSATSMKEIESMIPFPTIALSADPHNGNLKARLTVEKYVNEDDWNIAKLFFKPSIELHWLKGKYKYK